MCIATHPMLYGYQMKALERQYASLSFDYARPQLSGWVAERQSGERKAVSSKLPEQCGDSASPKQRSRFLAGLLALLKRVSHIELQRFKSARQVA